MNISMFTKTCICGDTSSRTDHFFFGRWHLCLRTMPLAIRDAANPLELERHNSQIRSLFWFAALWTRVPNAGSKFPVRERHRVMFPCPDKSSQQALQKGPLCLTVEPCSLMFKVGVYLQSQN